MFGKTPRLNPLESRKQLLLVESELNRAELVGNITELKAGVCALTGRATFFASIASSVAVLVAGLAAFQRRKSAEAVAKRSWLQTILKGAGIVSSVWLAFRSHRRSQNDKSEKS